jgi:hypothetical protein
LKRIRIPGAAAVGLLLLAAIALLRGPAALGGQAGQPANEQNQAKQIRGSKDMADGQIKTVACKGRAMDMTFDDSYEILRLHTDNYFKVNFSAINFTPSGTINPCKTAQGMYARVYYFHIKGHPKEGDLISVELRK